MRPGPDLINIQIPDPGLGDTVRYQLPAALGELQLMTLTFRFTTSAAVANRFVSAVLFDPQLNVKSRVEASAVQTASQVRRYTAGVSGTAATGDENASIPWLNAFARGDDIVEISPINIQGGDRLTRIFLWLERFAPAKVS